MDDRLYSINEFLLSSLDGESEAPQPHNKSLRNSRSNSQCERTNIKSLATIHNKAQLIKQSDNDNNFTDVHNNNFVKQLQSSDVLSCYEEDCHSIKERSATCCESETFPEDKTSNNIMNYCNDNCCNSYEGHTRQSSFADSDSAYTEGSSFDEGSCTFLEFLKEYESLDQTNEMQSFIQQVCMLF